MLPFFWWRQNCKITKRKGGKKEEGVMSLEL
jgi:hypothetical protein